MSIIILFCLHFHRFVLNVCSYRYDTQVLFTSSAWDNAQAICIGGNAAEYGPNDEYAWYNDAASYLFVSYNGGRSKAFLDCTSGGLVLAGDEAHLEINHIAETNNRTPNVPIVALRSGADTSALWSIDAGGAAWTNSGCQWNTDAMGFTAEMADGDVTRDAAVEVAPLQKNALARGTLISSLEEDDKERVVQAILYGEMTLIDLHVKEKAYSTDGDSYAGQISGVFCKVDFTQQKKDPSTGV